MLGRRNLRIKVMQVLYGSELAGGLPAVHLENELNRSIDRAVTLYLLNLHTASEVLRYSLADAELRAAKYIKSDDDKSFRPVMASNRLLMAITENEAFQQMLKKYKVVHYLDKETVKALYKDLIQSDEGKLYSKLEQPTVEADAHIFRYLVGQVLQGNESYNQGLEEQFANFHDEQDLLIHIIGKYLDGFEESGEVDFLVNVRNFEAEKKFGFDMLGIYQKHAAEFIPEIESALRNWELERIASIDLILIKMALCELKYFPIIPVKVTINEYIDISKMYSTPKSKEFVNGVLDKIKNNLIGRGEIKKMGRGLME